MDPTTEQLTTATMLQHAFELAGKRRGEDDVWERQARGLATLGYTIVSRDDADQLARMRAVGEELLTRGVPVAPEEVAALLTPPRGIHAVRAATGSGA